MENFSLTLLQKIQKMKNKRIVHAHEEAKIYHDYYKPSLNILRLIKSVLCVVISGSSPAAGHVIRRK